MKRYISEYIKNTEKILNEKVTKEIIDNHVNKISFFSHERLIHLIVTMFFALFTILFIFMFLVLNNYILLIICAIMIVILLFYIVHYYFLENSVQYLYTLYDKLKEKLK
ncbi:MAG: hypothetical protein IKR57_03245 [Bacilli bacterium]|nr:hypothetical protein [Bacilli bacterium]